MITTGYMILIAALLIVASLLLYARFVSRSREKSFHHGVGEFPPMEKEHGILDDFEEREVGSSDAAVEEVVEAPKEEVPMETEVEPVSEPTPASTVPVLIKPHDSVDTKRSEEEKEEGEYFDELQEAAAGLAMLMRSSPVTDRTTPVVYAPEEHVGNESPENEEIRDEEIEESPTEVLYKVEAPVEADVPAGSDFDDTGSESEEFLVESEIEVEEVTEGTGASSPDNLIALLGADVSDQIQKIDCGLDALEELVESIESNLTALGVTDIDRNEGEDLESAEVGEAA